MLLECHFVMECLAPSRLHAERFLPPTPYRVVVDHKGKDHSDDEGLPAANLEPGNPRKLVSQSVFRKDILPSMLQRAESIAEGQARTQIDEAAKAAEKSLTTEIERLRELSSRNSQISSAEIADLTDHRDELIRILGQSRLRLDALRLIWRAPG